MEVWTVQKLLNWITDYFTKASIADARLSAEMLMSEVLNKQRIQLYTDFEEIVPKPQLDKLHSLIKRAAANEPVAYLIGRTEFYSLEIFVNEHTLIPRPETEQLVEKAIDFLRTRKNKQMVLDLCTGSGCIAVAIAKNFPAADIIATDICESALQVAAKNIENHHLNEQIKLLQGNLFDPVIPQLDTSAFDLIVSNPPYISTEEFEKLDKNVKDYEPKLALLAGDEGLDVYKKIAAQVNQFLKPDAQLIMEIGYKQGPSVKDMLENLHCFSEVKIIKDFQRLDRIVIAKKSSQ
ncbi:MAG TPA: peptide chain release factor N(5)-glutamine methyltransferase [Sedimentisphaerales bacterium]|nr:peptide chain release factor N(5)-glutamine methyltransferase [Sedimentisphaerales bacterium]